MAKYSNAWAMRSLVKASLQAIFKSPSAIFFTLAFPMIFILVFGFVGSDSNFHITVAKAPGSDSTSRMYMILRAVPVLKWVDKDSAGINKMLSQGDIVATIAVQPQPPGAKPQYLIGLSAATSERAKAAQLQNILADVVAHEDPEIKKRQEDIARVDMNWASVRPYNAIDFILPGQLAFSLLASGVFGTAFVFFNLRQTLVLKRFFATPVRKEVIVISEAIARMLFQIVGTVIIIAVGYKVFGFTLSNGWITFVEMVALCALSLLVFMGFGFIVSGVAKTDAVIPLFSNIIVLPQMLLAGTFFPIDNFPLWLQHFCRILPLTYLNEALRKISFEGANLWDVRMDVLALLISGAVIYAAAAKLFKWE